MKLAKAIEGGLAGASTLSLLQEALHKFDHTSPRPLLHKSGLIKKLKKAKGGPGRKSSKLYIQLASELLANTAFFGLTGLGKKRNAVLRGGLLGAAAGLGSAFLQQDDKDDESTIRTESERKSDLKKKLLTVALYTSGGVLAGAAIRNFKVKGKKKKKR